MGHLLWRGFKIFFLNSNKEAQEELGFKGKIPTCPNIYSGSDNDDDDGRESRTIVELSGSRARKELEPQISFIR